MTKRKIVNERVEEALKVFTDSLVERIETVINSGWEKGWLQGAGGFWGLPQNIKGNTYMGCNAFLLQIVTAKEGYSMPVFMTFKQARELGCSVSKGEHHVPVFRWGMTVFDENNNKISEDEYHGMAKEDQKKCKVLPFLKMFMAYNIDQTNFKEQHPDRYASLLKKFHPDGESKLDSVGMYTNEALDNVIAGSWICPIKVRDGAGASFKISENYILVPSKRSFNVHPGNTEETFKDGQEYYSTVLHEMAHSTGHETMFGRPGLVNFQGFGSASYCKEELVAELTAAMVSNALGFDKRITDNSAAYLKHWAENLRQNPKYIVSVMTDVNQACRLELEHIDAERKKLGLKPLMEGNLDGIEEKKTNKEELDSIKEEQDKVMEFDKEYLDVATNYPADQLKAALIEIQEDHPEHPLAKIVNVSEFKDYFKGKDTSVANWVKDASVKQLVEEGYLDTLSNIRFRHNEGRTLLSISQADFRVNTDDYYKDYYLSLGEEGIRRFEHHQRNFNAALRRYEDNITLLSKYGKNALTYPDSHIWVERNEYIRQENMEKVETGKDKVYFSPLSLTSSISDVVDDDVARALHNTDKNQLLFEMYLGYQKQTKASWDQQYLTSNHPKDAGKVVLGEDGKYMLTYDETLTEPFELYEKVSDKQVRDMVNQQGIDSDSSAVARSVATDMVAEEFKTMRSYSLEMPNGDVLYVDYDKEKDKIVIGPATNAGIIHRHVFDYDHSFSLDMNIQGDVEQVESLPEYQLEESEEQEEEVQEEQITDEQQENTASEEQSEADKKKYYVSYNFLQTQEDTEPFDKLRQEDKYDEMLFLAAEHVQDSDIDLEYVKEHTHNYRGDDLLAENEDLAVVYNGVVGGTYDLLRKVSENDIREKIEREGGLDSYHRPKYPAFVWKIQRDMVQEEWSKVINPIVKTDSGKEFKLSYDRERDMIKVRNLEDGSLVETTPIYYDYERSVKENFGYVYEELCNLYPEQTQEIDGRMTGNNDEVLKNIISEAYLTPSHPLYNASGMNDFKRIFAETPANELESRFVVNPDDQDMIELKKMVAEASQEQLISIGASGLKNYHFPHKEGRTYDSIIQAMKRIEDAGKEAPYDEQVQKRVGQAADIYAIYRKRIFEGMTELEAMKYAALSNTTIVPRSRYVEGVRPMSVRARFAEDHSERVFLHLPSGEVKHAIYNIDKDAYEIGHVEGQHFVAVQAYPIKDFDMDEKLDLYRALTGIEFSDNPETAKEWFLKVPDKNIEYVDGVKAKVKYDLASDAMEVTSSIGGFEDFDARIPYDHRLSVEENLKVLADDLEYNGYKIKSYPVFLGTAAEKEQADKAKLSTDIEKMFSVLKIETQEGAKIMLKNGQIATLDTVSKTADVRNELIDACFRRMDIVVIGKLQAESQGDEQAKIAKLAEFHKLASVLRNVFPNSTEYLQAMRNYEKQAENNQRVSHEYSTLWSVQKYLDKAPGHTELNSISDSVIDVIKVTSNRQVLDNPSVSADVLKEYDDWIDERAKFLVNDYLKAEDYLKKSTDKKLDATVHEDSDLDTNVAAEAKHLMAAGVSAPKAEKIAKENFDDKKHAEMHQEEVQQTLQKEKEKQAEQQKAEQENKQKQVEAKKPTMAATHAALILGALAAAKEKDGIWLNQGFRKEASFLLSNTPVSPYNALIMHLSAESQGYRSNIYTTYNAAKDNGMPVLQGEVSLPLKWTKWTYVNNVDSSKTLTPKQFHALPKDKQKDYSVRASKEVIRAFNIDQTVFPSKSYEAYTGLIKEQGEQQEVMNLNNETKVYRQFAQLTKEHPDTIVILSEGDVYKTYKSSAKKLAKDLELPLSKAEYLDKEVDYIEFPKRRVDYYVPRLLEAGNRVAVCDGENGAILFKQNVDEKKLEVDLQKMAKTAAQAEGFKYERVMEYVTSNYDARTNTLVYSGFGEDGVSKKKSIITKANDVSRAIVAATGTKERLDRFGRNNMTPFDDEKYEKLVQELSTGVMMSRMGLPAKFSKENMQQIPFWETELQENPKMMGMIERDVNKSVEVIEKWMRGEKPNYSKMLGSAPEKVELSKKDYTAIQKINTYPSLDDKEIVIIKDKDIFATADVILPKGASLKEGTEVSGMRKDRIRVALRKEGIEDVRFYNAGGRWGLKQPNDYFKNKEASVVKLNQFQLETHQKLDLKEYGVKEKVQIESFKVLKNDDGKYFFHIKPVGEKSYDILPEKKYINSFFEAMRSRDAKTIGDMKKSLSMKFAELVSEHPDLRADYVTPKPSKDFDMSRITKANITSSKEDKNVKIVTAVIDGKYYTSNITREQWDRLWETDNMANYKKCVAAVTYEAELKQGRDNGQAEQQGENKDNKETVTNGKGEVPIDNVESKATVVQEPEPSKSAGRGM